MDASKSTPKMPAAGVIYRCPSGRLCSWVPPTGDKDRGYWSFRYVGGSGAEWSAGFALTPGNMRLLVRAEAR